jgi:hypothetical protein
MSLSILIATHSSHLVATKIIRLGDVLGAFGCYLVRARERKDKIVLGQSPSPEKATMAADSENTLRESMGVYFAEPDRRTS